MTRLYVVRHGRTAHNATRRIQGPLLDDPLDPVGEGQAGAVAERFARAHADGERFAAVYASPLKRAFMTAEAIGERLGLPVETVPGIQEFSWGKFLGRVAEGEVSAFVDEALKRWQAGELDFAAPEGESPRVAAERYREWLDGVIAKHPDESVILVAHGRINKILLADLVHGDLARMEDFPQSNTGVTLVEKQPAQGARTPWRVVFRNDRSHLDGTPFRSDKDGGKFA